MKKSTSLLAIAAIFLLGSSIVSAQQFKDTSFILPDSSGANFTYELSPTYMLSSGEEGDVDYYGVMLGLGWRIDQNNKLLLEMGFLFGSDSHYEDIGGGTIYSGDLDMYAYPILLSYNIHMPIGSNGRWEVEYGPMIGGIISKFDGNIGLGGSYWSVKDTDITYAVGLKLGVTYHISETTFVSLNVRYLYAGSTSYEILGQKMSEKGSDNYMGNIKVGWKF